MSTPRPAPDPLALAAWLERIADGSGTGPSVPTPDPFPPEALLRWGGARMPPEIRLWRCLRGEEPLGASPAGLALDADGPLWPSDGRLAIEVWTEAELCSLHALARLVRTHPELGPPVGRRMRSAVRWHLEHTQPDNATHRPWAVHLFLGHPDPDADLYGQTLLHNFEAAGRGEPEAAWILRDAAREIRLDPAVASRW